LNAFTSEAPGNKLVLTLLDVFSAKIFRFKLWKNNGIARITARPFQNERRSVQGLPELL